jgi:hypothetical protein
MKLKKRLLNDLKKAKINSFERMEDVLNKIFENIKLKKINTDDELLTLMNNQIINDGHKIADAMENGNIEIMESLMFEQNILNEYYSEFKVGEHRPIYYERELEGYISTKLDNDSGESLTFKVKNQK